MAGAHLHHRLNPPSFCALTQHQTSLFRLIHTTSNHPITPFTDPTDHLLRPRSRPSRHTMGSSQSKQSTPSSNSDAARALIEPTTPDNIDPDLVPIAEQSSDSSSATPPPKCGRPRGSTKSEVTELYKLPTTRSVTKMHSLP